MHEPKLGHQMGKIPRARPFSVDPQVEQPMVCLIVTGAINRYRPWGRKREGAVVQEPEGHIGWHVGHRKDVTAGGIRGVADGEE